MRAGLYDPGGVSAPWSRLAPRCCLRLIGRPRPPRLALSRLNHTAHTLAVYASQPGSPPNHARLATGCGPRFAGRASQPAWSLQKVSELSFFATSSLSPSPSFAWRTQRWPHRPLGVREVVMVAVGRSPSTAPSSGGLATPRPALYDGDMPIFGGASAGAVVKLRCPKCGEVQARARAPKGTTYECRKCGHPFTREEGSEKSSSKRGG